MKRRTEHFTYELLRSRRRSMSLKVELDGTITVRAPFRTPPETADWFVESHRDWIEVRLRAGEQILAVRPSYTETERLEGKKRAENVLKERCCYYAGLMGVSYGSITVREQKTRWGRAHILPPSTSHSISSRMTSFMKKMYKVDNRICDKDRQGDRSCGMKC